MEKSAQGEFPLLERAAELFGVQLTPDGAGVDIVDRLEKGLSRKLPETLRRWMQCSSATRALSEAMRGCELILPQSGSEVEVFIDFREISRTCRIAPGNSARIFPLVLEHQSVFMIAARLDGYDDPMVLLAREPAYEAVWLPHADSFSEFVLAAAWDQAFTASGRAWKEVHLADAEQIRTFRREGEDGELPMTYQAGFSVYSEEIVRIQRGSAALVLFIDGYDAPMSGLASDVDEERLTAFLRTLSIAQ